MRTMKGIIPIAVELEKKVREALVLEVAIYGTCEGRQFLPILDAIIEDRKRSVANMDIHKFFKNLFPEAEGEEKMSEDDMENKN